MSPATTLGTVGAGLATAMLLVAPPSTLANPQSEGLRVRAGGELYNLDYERSAATYRQAIAADPEDAAAYRGLASALWMAIGFERGTMTVDSYLGRISGDMRLPPPPKQLAADFHQAIDRAAAVARLRLGVNGTDPDALYQLGAAVGILASYTATVDGSVRAAFWSAREAYNAHERVLELDPRRQEASFVVGTYRYLVAAMPLPFRWAAYVAGFGGGKEKGLQLIETAASYAGDNQTDAKIALVLVYNRERRFGDALRELARLRTQYPRNRLLWLESGSTALRGGRVLRSRTFSERRHGPACHRRSRQDVRGRCDVVLQTWRRSCGVGTQRRRRTGPQTSARLRRACMDPGARTFRAGKAGAQVGKSIGRGD